MSGKGGLGGIVSKVTDTVGLTDTGAAEAAANQQSSYMNRVLAQLEKIDLPDIEKQRIALQLPKLVGELQSIDQEKTAFEDIREEDPELQQAKLEALRGLTERGREGLTTEDKLAFKELRGQVAEDEAARAASTLQAMARRGAQDSGMALMNQLSSSQQATQRAEQAGDRLASQALQSKRDALSQSANLAGNISQDKYNRDLNLARAEDARQNFNIQNQRIVQAANLQSKQDIANRSTDLRNQQQMYNTGLQQQQFQNEMSKAGATGGAMGNLASMYGQQAQAQAQRDASIIGAGAQLGSAFAKSDKNVKTKIKEITSDEIEAIFKGIKPSSYEYKDAPGDKVDGFMAQDLEKSKSGKSMVKEIDGIKHVSIPKMLSANTVGIADLYKRIKKLEGKE